MAYENLCMNCMREKGNDEQCPHCHFHNDSLQLPPFLPMHTVLQDRYIVGAVLDSNGDGTTYMGFDTSTETPVHIREFFPDTFAKRAESGTAVLIRTGTENEYSAMLGSFLDLWGKLLKMNGLSALVKVTDLFEANNTAYAVSEHVEKAQSLRDYLLSTKGGYLSWKDARVMFMPVLSTLATLHSAGIIHRGISPATLYLYPDRKIRIAGFSIPECRTVNAGLTTEIFPGYTPVEQLGVQSATGPWTDIYAFAAVLYRVLIGSTPIDAMVRMRDDEMMIPAEFADKLPDFVIGALINALQVLPEDRTRNVDDFRLELSGSKVAEFQSEFAEEERARRRAMYTQAAPEPEVGTPDEPTRPIQRIDDAIVRDEELISEPEPEPRRRHPGFIAFLSVLIIALLAMIALLASGKLGEIGFHTDSTTTAAVQDEIVEVPKMVGANIEDVEKDKFISGNFDIHPNYVYSSDVESGIIIFQSVEEGQNVPKGSTIELKVSKGPEKVIMPSGLVGSTLASATAKLEQAGFTVQSVEKANDGSQTSGTVYATSLTGGESYDKGTTCILTVWGEPETETTTESTTTIGQGIGEAIDNILTPSESD
ncbi:MAG: PASTA domain-containing protein [Clostridia bacterium]|nr:PASTA domain-containing protein [Clostridia bacterium]